MFDSSNCIKCEDIDCRTKCQWITIDKESARIEMDKMIRGEESFILKQCVTCFGCEEYCPYNSHPFDLIIELQEKFNSLSIDPGFLETVIKKSEPHDDLIPENIDPNKPILNKCSFGKSHATHMKGRLFRDLQSIGGIDYTCNFIFHHYARQDITKKRAAILLKKINELGIKEMICYHDECYSLYTKIFPEYNLKFNFKVTSLYEYIYTYLKENESDITKLNMKIAYQRPCSSRFIPEIDDWVDKICELIGLNRVAREYDREHGMCCTGVFALIGKKKMMRKAQNDNIEDMVNHGAEACAYNCPLCMASLGFKVKKKGLKNYLLTDLCRLALGEKLE